MTIRVRHVQFRPNKAGALIHGTDPVEPDDFDLAMHCDRAVFLTSRLEAPKWGTVQSYDGAAMSGGLLHNIAIAPRTMQQGSLFELLRQIEVTTGDTRSRTSPNRSVRELWDALRHHGYFVGRDGKLRTLDTGGLVSARDIRALFTPPNGNVPRSGEHWVAARHWAVLFHQLFADPATRRGQISYAAEWMARSRADLEIEAYDAYTDADTIIDLPAHLLDPAIDLAMCVYHSFSVNGPTPAARALKWTLGRATPGDEPVRFGELLCRKLGTTKHGVWRERRYPATRRAARRMELWTKDLVDRLLPKLA